jgi:competence protein ComEC
VPNVVLRKLAIGLVALVIADLAAFLVTAPLGLAWFAQLPLAALLVNLVAIPAMSLVVFPAGLVWLLVALVWPWLGEGLAPVVSAIGGAFDAFILETGGLAGTPAVAGWPVLAGVAASLAGIGVLAGGRWRRPGLVVFAVAGLASLAARWPSGALEVWALDVGHGDAIVVRTPAGGVAMIDAGGSPRSHDASRGLAQRVVAPALGALGIGHIDRLVITHADRDHVGAAADVARQVPVRELWISPCAEGDPRVAAVARIVREGGGVVRVVARQAPMEWDGVVVELLWPPPDARRWDGSCRWSTNDSAIVVRLGFGGRHVLLAGDIEAAAEAELVAREGAGLQADVLKVPHHGSRTSSAPALLDAVAPGVALVSGELGHMPMPPHPEVLWRYAARGIAVHTTGSRGAARVRIGADGALAVEAPFRPP